MAAARAFVGPVLALYEVLMVVIVAAVVVAELGELALSVVSMGVPC